MKQFVFLTLALSLTGAVTAQDAGPAASTSAQEAQAHTADAPTPAVSPAEPTPGESQSATVASAQPAQEKPFKVPAGYKVRHIKGEVVYCKEVVNLGSRFGKQVCLSRDALEELEEQGEQTRQELRQHASICGAAAGSCASG
ncbi:MAG: hypothetical protein R3E77_02635 [Steroidobacteraceae bacterium]